GRAGDINESGPAHLGRDQLCGERDAGEQPRELARGAGAIATLLFENVLLHGHHGCVHGRIIPRDAILTRLCRPNAVRMPSTPLRTRTAWRTAIHTSTARKSLATPPTRKNSCTTPRTPC